jgi:hypothetical protein
MSGNPWSSDISEEKVCLSPDEFSINNSDDWTCALEKNYDKGSKFSTFRCDNKEKLLEITKDYWCFLKLILDERNKYEKCLGILEYRNGYPFVNNKEASNYNNYKVENYVFIRENRDVKSTMKLIFNCFRDNLQEEGIVLNILIKDNMELRAEHFKNKVEGQLENIPLRPIMIKEVETGIYELETYIPIDKYTEFQNIVGKEIDFEIYQYIKNIKIKVIERGTGGGTSDKWDSVSIKFKKVN